MKHSYRFGGLSSRVLRFGSFLAVSLLGLGAARAASFDAAPGALPLPSSEGVGLIWEDPREIHEVRVAFDGAAPAPGQVRLEYWGSWWPERHLPKDREPGGGDIGWMELGNWWKYGWRKADAEVIAVGGSELVFHFRPVNAVEFPKAADYPAAFRYTLKLRLVADTKLPPLRRLQALTDSQWAEREVRLAWKESAARPRFGVFNGEMLGVEKVVKGAQRLRLRVASNPDPNTFDRTLVTVTNGTTVFTFRVDDLAQGALLIPHAGVAVLPQDDARDYSAVAAAVAGQGGKTLRQRVAELPEQTWSKAWEGMPRKKTDIYFPLGLDGGRQRFRVWAAGHIDFRHNDEFLRGRPGADSPRLSTEPGPSTLDFGIGRQPVFRTLADEALPVVTARWDVGGLLVEQTAFVTPLGGMRSVDVPIEGDTPTVLMVRFSVTNTAAGSRRLPLALKWVSGGKSLALGRGAEGALRVGTADGRASWDGGVVGDVAGEPSLEPGRSVSWTLKVPYLVPSVASEREQLAKLDYERERVAVEAWWRGRLAGTARLVTPEPMLNEFHRSVGMHLLVNCEREPGAARRFARVGSFSYGAYGNESCMMVVDLERRGLHREAQECLDAWLHYQGTVELPGSFASKEGVLYGAGGYEAGGYNQHHGWILWMMAEHYRFTRDAAWLQSAAAGMVAGADWILRETARTADRHPLERGLLPAGSLEDIGDWWTWLSTSCYTWRGLDSAAWALEQVGDPNARRIRRGADDYHRALLANFRQARDRSPVVRLRDGTAVPKIPSQVHRRGRSFGWICETLEGPLHLLITRAMDAKSMEARWILDDYEDNLYLSNQYGYTVPDFEKQWFSLGGMSMQACLLFQVEPWLYRDDVKHALRGLFNAEAASYFPTVRMNTEHALPQLDDWRGDQFKSSDEANCAGWLRQLFVREDNEQVLLLGQAVPRDWLRPGRTAGIEQAATWFGPVSLRYEGRQDSIDAKVEGPRRNPPKVLRVRFRDPSERPIESVRVNGKPWRKFAGEWVELPGNIGSATVEARFVR